MSADLRRARRALRTSGARGTALWWPFGQQRRAHLLLRQRLAVLEAKNAVAGMLFRRHRPDVQLPLSSAADVERALSDPDKRKALVGMSVSREVIEEELLRRPGADLGRSLDQALAELIREGTVLRVPGKALLMPEDAFVAATTKRQPHYDPSELNRLVREGSGYGSHLRARARRERQTTVERSYRL